MNQESNVILGVVVLFAAALGVLVFPATGVVPERTEFQQLIGGLGFGSEADLSRCAFGFDPRIDRQCSRQESPVPCGMSFCPVHGVAVFTYSKLANTAGETPNGPLPPGGPP